LLLPALFLIASVATATPTPIAEDCNLKAWDPAVWKNEMMREVIFKNQKSAKEAKDVIDEETYNNSKKGLAASYQAITKS
jgi:hypothetical protein